MEHFFLETETRKDYTEFSFLLLVSTDLKNLHEIPKNPIVEFLPVTRWSTVPPLPVCKKPELKLYFVVELETLSYL